MVPERQAECHQRCFGLSAKPLSGRYLSFADRGGDPRSLRAQGYFNAEAVALRLGRAVSTISRELRRNAATRSGGLEYRATTAQWHAERAARRPKQAKLALNAALRTYVEERLAGVVVVFQAGLLFAARPCPWKGRADMDRGRAGGGRTPGARNRSPAACRSTSRTMRPCAISHEAIYQALFVQGRGALQPRADGSLAHRAGVADAEGAHARARQDLHLSRDHDQPTSGRSSRSRRAGPPGREDLILGLGNSAIGTMVERMMRFTLLLHLPRMTGDGHRRRA